MDETTAPAERFVDALATRDFQGITAVLTPDARFRYLIPPGPGETQGAESIAATFGQWFGDADLIEIQESRIESLPGRTSARYRFLVHKHQQREVIEQQTYIDVDEEERVVAIDLLCSGFRPAGGSQEDESGTHRFDAGTLGCADGLAQEFRRRILGIPLGDVLIVETTDPAAKEDLPPLARMMGHKIHSVEPNGGGRLTIKVERGR